MEPQLFWRKVTYSSSEASSAFAETWLAAMQRTKNPMLAGIAGLGTFVTAFVSTYALQGKAIEEAYRAQGKSPIKMLESVNLESQSINNNATPTFKSSAAVISVQLLYTTSFTLRAVASDYFLLTMVLDLFSISLSMPYFCGIYGISLAINLLSNFSNVVWEGNVLIAKRFGQKNSAPFYRKLFYPISGKRGRKTLSIVGSGHHVIVEDLIPWLGYVPKSAITYLQQNPGARAAVISIACICGPALAVLIFVQTYFFEGKCTEKKLRKLANELQQASEKYLPTLISEILRKTINLMGPLHGISGAMPVYYFVSALLEDPTIKWPIAIIVTLLTFLGISIGVHNSEVWKTKKELADMTAPAKISDKVEEKIEEKQQTQPLLVPNNQLTSLASYNSLNSFGSLSSLESLPSLTP